MELSVRAIDNVVDDADGVKFEKMGMMNLFISDQSAFWKQSVEKCWRFSALAVLLWLGVTFRPILTL